MLRATWIQAGRALRRSLRMPTVVVQALAFPVALMLLLLAAFRDVVGDFDPSRPYIQRLVPMVAITGALFGGLANGAGLVSERIQGLHARFRALASPRIAPLAGRVLAEMARTALGTVVMVGVGMLVGFRFSQGPVAAVAFVAVVALYAVPVLWIVIALALRARTYEQLAILGPLFLLLLFLNTGFVPLEAYPGVVQPVVRIAPHTAATEVLLGLSDGGPVAWPLLRTTLWAVGITVVFATLAVRRFRQG